MSSWKEHLARAEQERGSRELFQAMQSVQRAFEDWERGYLLPEGSGSTGDDTEPPPTSSSRRPSSGAGAPGGGAAVSQQAAGQFLSVADLLGRVGQKVDKSQQSIKELFLASFDARGFDYPKGLLLTDPQAFCNKVLLPFFQDLAQHKDALHLQNIVRKEVCNLYFTRGGILEELSAFTRAQVEYQAILSVLFIAGSPPVAGGGAGKTAGCKNPGSAGGGSTTTSISGSSSSCATNAGAEADAAADAIKRMREVALERLRTCSVQTEKDPSSSSRASSKESGGASSSGGPAASATGGASSKKKTSSCYRKSMSAEKKCSSSSNGMVVAPDSLENEDEILL
mmetsp:Transcript_28681/g.72629  ORF Transcript_28681/g.72629 Transcript_28681/m.72629 type:complete len:340 (-) Transcript_28681:222-1241(-)|eukprot:CAMPEP_0178997094 /NCGR_PEP_ID=MMETSP0795-20121207/8740_1 /TAXON_ID=88552 /ORGANISM="Amoebophrya sp., Strain Ameob2" /LENGTH=339 /DNA_ID=CAMNT_0020689571 /DNA_START=71 /DNA_END=1090 /DNA_ORIENTATION=-